MTGSDALLREVAEGLDRAVQASMSDEGVATWKRPDDRWVPLDAINAAAAALPCPIRSSLTDEPCVLLWGHAPDSPRFHRFRAALDATDEPEPLDVNALADDVRYSGGNGTSDYWRGFNDGIDKLAARISAPVDREDPA